MRTLFFGTSPFAVPALESLLWSRHEVVGIVTQPDRPHGRGLQLSQSAVKKAALSLAPHLPILQPEKARTREFREQAAALEADIFVVAAFGQILSKRLLDTPRYGGINIHGSLLPRWRGAAPMQYCLIAGDRETGVTTMQMDAGLDTGDMLLQCRRTIGESDTVETLEVELARDGATLMLETLTRLERGDCPRIEQEPTLATYAPSIPPDFGYVDFNRSATEIVNLVRGVTPRPGGYVGWGGRRIKLWTVRRADDEATANPGVILKSDATGIIVQTGGGTSIMIIDVQPESKARMSASEWARGARASRGSIFELLRA